jgi:hypothetical protein
MVTFGDDHDGWDDWDDDPRVCSSNRGKLRGPVTAESDSGYIEVMGTLAKLDLIPDHSSKALDPDEVEVGDRVEIRIKYTDDGWVVYRLREWRGDKEQAHGYIEEILDGEVRGFRVFDTLVKVPMHVDDDDDDWNDDDDDDDHDGWDDDDHDD